MSKVIQLNFSNGLTDRITGERLEVKAIDLETGFPVAALPVKEMGAWLKSEGFQWRPGSNAVWVA